MMEPRGWLHKSASAVGEGGGSAGGIGSAWESIFVVLGGLSIMMASEEVPGSEQSANKTEGTWGGNAGVVSLGMLGWIALKL